MSVLFRLAAYAFRYRILMVAAYVSLTLSTLFQVAVPRLMGNAIDVAKTDGASSELWTIGGTIVIVTLLRGFFFYWQTYLGENVSQRVAYHIRNAFYDNLQRLSFGYHDQQHTGNLMSKATVDVEGVRMFVNMGLVRAINIVLMIILVAGLLFSMDPALATVSLVFVPFIIWRAAFVSPRMRRLWGRVQRETGNMTTILQENLIGTRVVKAFGAEEHEQAKFDRHTNQVFRSTYNAQKLQASNTAVMTFIFFGATGAILWLGGRAVVEGRMTEGELAQFILYIGLLVQPVRMIGWLVNTFARAVSSGERIFEVLDAKSPVQESPTAKTLAGIKGSVGFHNVGFDYGDKPVLQDISVVAAPGQVVALLGSPGSGKSTMVHLLSRFYDVTDGSITIDDTDIRGITLESLRHAVGIVQQDVFIFSTTIWENIAYGKANATDDEVINASKMAQLHDEIMRLPNNYDTLVGERGVTLSGGQRQRLSIARTLLMDPPILVLDDSTSSVDAATEARIQQAMTAVFKGRTTFVIAHRITSVQHADNVVVLENGRIAESGPPQQLLASGGLYQQLADLQRDPEAAAQAVWERLASLPGQAGGAV